MSNLLWAIWPVLTVLVFFYLVDSYDRETLFQLFKKFVLGMFVVVPVLIIGNFLNSLGKELGGEIYILYVAFVLAAFNEEFFKWLAFTGIKNKKYFNEYLDGIIYAVFVSMGFAIVENIIYVAQYGRETAILRAVTSIPMHMMFGVVMGYYFSLGHFSKKFIPKILSLVVPILLHGIYDYILLSKLDHLMLLFVPYFVFIVYSSKNMIRNYLKISKNEGIISNI